MEWIVEARGCSPTALRDLATLQRLFAKVISDLRLNPVGDPLWHQFEHPSGITGMCMLAESHLTCHTFPEYGSLCLNLFCCREREEWDFDSHLRLLVGASQVSVCRVKREYGSDVSRMAAFATRTEA